MKKVIVIVMTLFCAVILIFTFFGEKIYYSIHPKVEIERVSMMIGDKPVIPKSAVYSDESGDYVYTLSSSEGFSMTIYTVHKTAVMVSPCDINFMQGDEYAYLESGLGFGEMIVVMSTKGLLDGCRVTILE